MVKTFCGVLLLRVSLRIWTATSQSKREWCGQFYNNCTVLYSPGHIISSRRCKISSFYPPHLPLAWWPGYFLFTREIFKLEKSIGIIGLWNWKRTITSTNGTSSMFNGLSLQIEHSKLGGDAVPSNWACQELESILMTDRQPLAASDLQSAPLIISIIGIVLLTWKLRFRTAGVGIWWRCSLWALNRTWLIENRNRFHAGIPVPWMNRLKPYPRAPSRPASQFHSYASMATLQPFWQDTLVRDSLLHKGSYVVLEQQRCQLTMPCAYSTLIILFVSPNHYPIWR
jgi:hypothetical protein